MSKYFNNNKLFLVKYNLNPELPFRIFRADMFYQLNLYSGSTFMGTTSVTDILKSNNN